ESTDWVPAWTNEEPLGTRWVFRMGQESPEYGVNRTLDGMTPPRSTAHQTTYVPPTPYQRTDDTGAAAAAPLMGMRTVTTRPPPSRGTAVTVPPCARTIARTIDRPRPAPLADSCRSALSLRNGS